MESGDTFRILRNDKVGRYVVAGRDLQQGEMIFSETPFVFGPKADSPPQCLGCYAPSDCTILCSKCGWPVCGPECEATPAHRDAECAVFSASKVKFQPVEDVTTPCSQYDCIMHLRMLLAKEKNPERWEKEVKDMETHNDIRRKCPCWGINQINVVDFLLGPCKLNTKADEELLHRLCGIIEINAFEGRSANGYALRVIYPKLAMLSHSCVSNISHAIFPINDKGEEYRVYVRTTLKIPKDGELFASYTYSLGPTLLRREHLKEGKYFDCACERCADPTELGTYMSSMKCQRCDPGVILSSNPLDSEAPWKCTNCDFTARGDTIKKVFSTIQAELDMIELAGQDSTGVEQREHMFRKYRSVLHPKHAFMTSLRQSLSQMYGRIEGYMLEDLPDILLERKAELCRDLLKVLDVVEPGYSRIRGMTLYELHAPLILLAKNLRRNGLIDKSGLKTKLQEVIAMLEEAANILSFESPATPEGIIGIVASQSLQQLKDSLDVLVEKA